MWMSKSVEGSSIASGGNFHDRNRFGAPYEQRGGYGGGAAGPDAGAGDWKSKILESGQWLGGKVIEYGGKLARGPGHDSIPDHLAQQMPRNDGRANWMADIRSSSSSYAGGGSANSYSSGGTNTYQNDFVTERPKAYSDYSRSYNPSSASTRPQGYVPQRPEGLHSKHDKHSHHESKSGRRVKKKSENKKSKKVSKKSKHKKKQSSSESDSSSSESDASSSESEASDSTESDERVASRRKPKPKAKAKKTKKTRGFYSEESESDDEKPAANYSYSFDPAKLPPPPADSDDENQGTKKHAKQPKAKSKHGKKDKSGKKPRSRRQSMLSSGDEDSDASAPGSDKENSRKSKRHGSKKATAKSKASSSASVDLLGVDFESQPVVPAAPVAAAAAATGTASASSLQQPSVFDAPLDPLQDLAGLSFTAPVQNSSGNVHLGAQTSMTPMTAAPAEVEQKPASETFRSNLVPDNDIVDFSSLASEKKKPLSANPGEQRTLNDLQKARGGEQPVPVMAMAPQGMGQSHMQQGMPAGMMQQLNMNQLQITDGSTGMQPGMQMPMQGMNQVQQMPMQPQMGAMPPQMMNMQMQQMQQQQQQQQQAMQMQMQMQQRMTQGAMNGGASSSSDPFSHIQ